MPNRYCQELRQKFQETAKKLDKIENLLLEYRNTGKDEIYNEIKNLLKGKPEKEKIEEFKKEYRLTIIELIGEWYSKNKKSATASYYFLDPNNFKINERGRIEIKNLDLSDSNLVSIFIPSLIESIENLNLSYNKIKTIQGLDKVNIKKLDLRYNKISQIQGLDNLISLKELDLRGNPVFSKYRSDDPETVKEVEKLRKRGVKVYLKLRG
jgi:Leucine-rich repeat (LRR) protein